MISWKKALHLMFMLLLMPPIGRNLNYRMSLNQVRKHYIEKRRKCRISIISGYKGSMSKTQLR